MLTELGYVLKSEVTEKREFSFKNALVEKVALLISWLQNFHVLVNRVFKPLSIFLVVFVAAKTFAYY